MMTKQEILESGVLETYVLGGCTEEEISAIDILSTQDEEVRDAIFKQNEILENMALGHAKPMPIYMKDRIQSRLDIGIDREVNYTKSEFWKKLSIAASVAACISLAGNFYLSNKVNDTKSALEISQLQNQRIAAEAGYLKERQLESSSQLNLLLSDKKKTIVMSGQAFAPQAKATVYWNGNEVYLFTNAFPENKVDTQYQLWAIIDGKPVDAGVFDVNKGDSKLIKLKNVSNASAFAVTEEKKGGSVAPSLDKMLVLGMVEG